MTIPTDEQMWAVHEALRRNGFQPQSIDGALALLAIAGTTLCLEGYDRKRFLEMAAVAFDASGEELQACAKENGSA